MVITDTEPERLALSRQRQWASAGFAGWRRAVAPTDGEEFRDVQE